MANYCEGILTIEGTEENINAFKIRLRIGSQKSELEPSILMKYILPAPTEGMARNWRREYWGTKWDIEDQTIIYTNNGCTCYFSTTWSPINPFVKHLGMMFPELKVDYLYYEAGNGFAGEISVVGGRVEEENEYDVDDPVPYIKFVREHFDENVEYEED